MMSKNVDETHVKLMKQKSVSRLCWSNTPPLHSSTSSPHGVLDGRTSLSEFHAVRVVVPKVGVVGEFIFPHFGSTQPSH